MRHGKRLTGHKQIVLADGEFCSLRGGQEFLRDVHAADALEWACLSAGYEGVATVDQATQQFERIAVAGQRDP